MSTTSTIAPTTNAQNLEDITKTPKFIEPKSPTLLITSLWLFSSIFSAAKASFNANVQGTMVSFNMQDVVLIAFASWMLHRGLSSRNVALIFPWVVVTFYGLYYNHFKSLQKMMIILKSIRNTSITPWLALFLTAVGIDLMEFFLALRIILTIRILQLSAHLWYRRKLEKELFHSMTSK